MLTPQPRFPAVDRDLAVDVVVVGSGITGVTTAWLLRREGRRVVLIDRDRAGGQDSQRTTAHLTFVTDQRLHELVKHFGEDGARAAWEAGAAAIDQIAANVRDSGAQCNFRRVPGYLHAPLAAEDTERDEEVERLREDALIAGRFGFDARYIERVPDCGVPGVRFGDQAAFDPGRYIAALLPQIPGDGSHVFENTALASIEEKPRRVVTANGHEIRCDYIVIATHNPLSGSVSELRSALLQTRLSLYTSYVLGARLPVGTLPDALYWDTSDPYDYLRIEPRPNHQLVIFGGADAKTGQVDDESAFRELEQRLASRLPGAQLAYRWLGQVIETDDGLPYIGEHADREFIATGFAGNGYTFGTVAGMMARDAFLGRSNPWSTLFRVDRKPVHGGVLRYLRENLDYPWYLLRDRLVGDAKRAVEEVPVGEGRVVALDAGKCAVFRRADGTLSIRSAVCTHLKCLVHWNSADRTWDCPCHGSRFAPEGEVISGPAEQPLPRIEPDKD